jgi:hypothetical protein
VPLFIAAIIEASWLPERLVVGTGSYGRMRPDPAGEHRRPTAAALRLRWQSVW